MILNKRIPKEFYSLFRTKNMDAYMAFLVEIRQAGSTIYTAIGLTIEEAQNIITETISKSKIEWHDDSDDNADCATEEGSTFGVSSQILRRLIKWGWLKSDYDERYNTYVLSFPEYSQLYVELFEKLQKEDDSTERESILSIYSALFTYHSDKEKNNEILKSALRTSKNLEQLMSNMQNGMRVYFEELSKSKNFIGIQQVLVDEINNNDSKRYAILTTTDSFYRYKEAVKELISQILRDNENQRIDLEAKLLKETPETTGYTRLQYAVNYCDEAAMYVYQVERSFDIIERKYNKLIEQKAVFARRALARIRYIFQEGVHDEDNILKLLKLIDTSSNSEEILEKLGNRVKLTNSFKIFDDDSLYKRRDSADSEFVQLATTQDTSKDNNEITDFVPKPLYTKRELNAFKVKNMQNGVFKTTKKTVSDITDLEKLMFLWQENTENQSDVDNISLGAELKNKEGFIFTELTIK
jgi:hypothetical protein